MLNPRGDQPMQIRTALRQSLTTNTSSKRGAPGSPAGASPSHGGQDSRASPGSARGVRASPDAETRSPDSARGTGRRGDVQPPPHPEARSSPTAGEAPVAARPPKAAPQGSGRHMANHALASHMVGDEETLNQRQLTPKSRGQAGSEPAWGEAAAGGNVRSEGEDGPSPDGRAARSPPREAAGGGVPPPRTKWTRRVPHHVLIGHAASLTPY